jgi:aminomethyltransferase
MIDNSGAWTENHEPNPNAFSSLITGDKPMLTDSNLKRTPLSAEHEALGAKMVDFAGWWMPVQYKGLKEEHLCVRQNVGLFDVSHMGEIRVKGAKALATLQWLTTNDVAKLANGEAHYSLLPNDEGGLVDDIIVYCVDKNADYLVCVNASNAEKDFQWMLKHNQGADITNESSQWAQIAVQGPKALALVDKVLGTQTQAMKPFRFVHTEFEGYKSIVATTGYTGESGCEVFIHSAGAVALWRRLLAAGASDGVQAIGLGARDTLRTEKKYSLYGHEIDHNSNPYAAGLGWVIKPEAKKFLGMEKILAGKASGQLPVLVGLKLVEKGIPRQGYKLFDPQGEEIGFVTSGTVSPSLDEAIGIAYIASNHSAIGHEFYVDIRGRKVKSVVCKTPFV